MSFPSTKLIQLPRSSGRHARQWAHLKLVRSVQPSHFGSTAFDGPILRPGARAPAETLGPNPVLIECAGPRGPAQRGKRREVLWILWRYDSQSGEWIEVARAAALGWEWAIPLREAASQVLQPKPVINPGHDIAQDLLDTIDRLIEPEPREVQLDTLASVYDQVAGRIAMRA